MDELEFKNGCISKNLGFSPEEIKGIFEEISHRAPSKVFYLKEFRNAIYGKQLTDLSRILYNIEEKLRSQGKSPDVFFQRESENITFKSFAEILSSIEPGLKCEEIDTLASRMDTNADGLISKTEFMNLYHEYLDFNEFKRYLVRHAQESGKQIQDLFYITSMDDGMRKDDFFKFSKNISKGKLLSE